MEEDYPRTLLEFEQRFATLDDCRGYLLMLRWPEGFRFRFNRRKSASRGKLFYRLAQQAVQVGPAPFDSIIRPQSDHKM